MFSRPQLQPRAKRAKSPCADSVTDGFLNGIAAQVSKKKSKKIKRAPFKSNTKLGSTSNHTPSPCHPFLRAIAAMCSMCARQREYISRKQNACWNTWLADWLTGNEEGQIMRTHTHTHSHADRVDNVHQRLDQGGAGAGWAPQNHSARCTMPPEERKKHLRGRGGEGGPVCEVFARRFSFPPDAITQTYDTPSAHPYGARGGPVCVFYSGLGKGKGLQKARKDL